MQKHILGQKNCIIENTIIILSYYRTDKLHFSNNTKPADLSVKQIFFKGKAQCLRIYGQNNRHLDKLTLDTFYN